MRLWVERVRRFLDDEDGPTAVEYGGMLAFIIIVCFAAVSSLGTNTSGSFSNPQLNNAAGARGS